MKIDIYSRNSIERLFHKNFPQNTAVISFYDPDRYNNDKNYTLVDYSEKADSVLYIPLDDFQTELPEARKIAEFVYSAKSKEMQIICQCESGQNRSAGCAAAILEYFNQAGNLIFSDDRYHPDEMVYYAVLDALEAFSDNKYLII
jgi:protein-tyrosine phosphatase